MNTLAEIFKYKIVAIVRGARAEDVLQIAGALQQGGIKLIEITMNSPKALEGIRAVSESLGDTMIVGAGSVLDAQTACNALEAGARFVLSPTVDTETIKITKRYGAVSIPGAFTPTEILKAFNEGGDIIKVFPISSVGPGYIKDVHAPLPQIPLMATGGIHLDNIRSYLEKGSEGIGLGSSLVDTKQVVNDIYLKELTKKAADFVSIANDF
jgi:2-dehydro-3-deoxyphosphogluconate aldolase / (4S)-4-hydroxy-2-oxoglutarate aldolase